MPESEMQGSTLELDVIGRMRQELDRLPAEAWPRVIAYFNALVRDANAPAPKPKPRMQTQLSIVPPPIDAALLEVLRATKHLKQLATAELAGFWAALIATYDRVEELFIDEEIRKLDLWLEANPGRMSHSVAGWKRRIMSWMERAQTGALRRAAAKKSANRPRFGR